MAPTPRPAAPGEVARPLLTVSLVTYNGMRWLPRCLASLSRQTLTDYELIVLDNASTDGSVEWLRTWSLRDPRMRLDESDENLGFAKAHNRNIMRARGEFVLLLNQDIELDEGFLEGSVEPFARDATIAAVQGRLLRLGPDGARTTLLDSTGLELHRDRRAVSRAQCEPDGPAHATAGPVWGADGAAPVYRRSALLGSVVPRHDGAWEVLDEDFFMYKEDVDLAWRLRLLGWSAWYAPAALAWHARGAGGAPGRNVLELIQADKTIPRWIKAISWRNHRLMQVKNESVGAYLADLPWILKREVMSLTFMALVDPRRLRVVPDLVRALPRAMRKRRYLSRRRAGAQVGQEP